MHLSGRERCSHPVAFTFVEQISEFENCALLLLKKQDGVTWNFMKTNTVSGLDQGEPGLYDRLPWCRFGELSFCLNYPLSSEIPPDLLDWFAEVAYSSAKMLQHFTSFYLPRFTRLVSLVSLAVQLQQACHSSCPAKAVDFA